MSGRLAWRCRPALLALALCLGAGGCGGDRRAGHSTAVVSDSARAIGDEDGDSRGRSSYFDADDAAVRYFGRAASAGDARAITALVARYYAAARAGGGARACALLFYIVAESIPEQYGRPPGPLYLSGARSCPAVLSRVFAHFHTGLATPPTVIAVRVSGERADALLGWTALPAGHIKARREGRVWRLEEPLAVALP